MVGEGKRPNKGRVAHDAPRDVMRTKERARYLRWRPFIALSVEPLSL